MKKLIFNKENKKWKMSKTLEKTHHFFKEIIWTQEDRPSKSIRTSSLMELLFHMSSHVRDVIRLFLFILVILFLWSLMSISSLTWLCEEPSWTTTPYFSTLALLPWSIWCYGWINICEPEQGRFNVWNQTFMDGDAGKTAVFLFFLARLWDCTAGLHKEGCYSQWCNTYLSRIDRIFVNLPVAEARDFLCYSHVFENLGERSIPWLHRFKLPNLLGNLSPCVEEAGVYVKRVTMERENIWRWCSAFTGGWPTGCLCHTQVTQSQETH